MEHLGKFGKDIVTGYEGVIIAKANYLYAGSTYALQSQKINPTTQKPYEPEWFDEARVQVTIRTKNDPLLK
jgi:hypothetical protein